MVELIVFVAVALVVAATWPREGRVVLPATRARSPHARRVTRSRYMAHPQENRHGT